MPGVQRSLPDVDMTEGIGAYKPKKWKGPGGFVPDIDMSMMDENGRIKPPPPKKKPIVQQPKRKVKPMSLEEKVENDTKTRAKLPPRQPRASRNEPNAATGKNNSLKRKRSPTSEHSRSAAVGGTARNDVKKVKARKKLQSASPEPMKSDGAGSSAETKKKKKKRLRSKSTESKKSSNKKQKKKEEKKEEVDDPENIEVSSYDGDYRKNIPHKRRQGFVNLIKPLCFEYHKGKLPPMKLKQYIIAIEKWIYGKSANMHEYKSRGVDVIQKLKAEKTMVNIIEQKNGPRKEPEAKFPYHNYLLKPAAMKANGYPDKAEVFDSEDSGWVCVPELALDFKGDVKKPLPDKVTGRFKMIGLDCEMVTTTEGSELARATLVDEEYNVVYDELCVPPNQIVDYQTK